MATIAVFIALGGTSYAAIKVTGKNVKDASLTGKDVRNSSLTGLDVRNGTLLTGDFKAGQIPAGPQGPKGNAGPKGDKGDACLPSDPAWVRPPGLAWHQRHERHERHERHHGAQARPPPNGQRQPEQRREPDRDRGHVHPRVHVRRWIQQPLLRYGRRRRRRRSARRREGHRRQPDQHAPVRQRRGPARIRSRHSSWGSESVDPTGARRSGISTVWAGPLCCTTTSG